MSCCKGDSCKDELRDDADKCGGDCTNCTHEEIDVSKLGPESIELAKMFDDVNANLLNALKTRKEILEMIHSKTANSPELKEKFDQVLRSRHPVLIQFVFGQ